MNYDGKMQIFNLILKGQILSDSVSSNDFLDFSVGYGDDTVNRISVTLIKNQSKQRFCDISNCCNEWAQVDFELSAKEDTAVALRYNIADKDVTPKSDTLELLYRDGYTIAKERVVWKKRAFLGKAETSKFAFNLSNLTLM